MTLPAQQYRISTVAGGPPLTGMPAGNAALVNPRNIASDTAGNLYIDANSCIFKVGSDGLIVRVAGTGTDAGTRDQDGGGATNAYFLVHSGLAVDPSGNLYTAESLPSKVLRITPAGTIGTVAGNGIFGYSGDGGAATSAELEQPFSLATDAAGNLYIADSIASVIRKVSVSGTITTFAGNGTPGYSGDGGPAIAARLANPAGLTVDTAGNLYIADAHNNCIRKVAPDGTISTLAGNGAAGFSGDGGPAATAQLNSPAAVAVDASGNVYIADGGNARVRLVSPDGRIQTIAGNGTSAFSGDGGPATSAGLDPSDVAIGPGGSLFVLDSANRRVRQVSAAGRITTAAGNGSFDSSGDGGPATAARFTVRDIGSGDAGLYIADSANQSVRRVTPDGLIHTFAGGGSIGTPAAGEEAASLAVSPIGIGVDGGGNVYLPGGNAAGYEVAKISPNGSVLSVFQNSAVTYSGDNEAFAVDAAGSTYQSPSGIYRVSPSGTATRIAGGGILSYGCNQSAINAMDANIGDLAALAPGPSGIFYLADKIHYCVFKVDANGKLTTAAGNGLLGYSGDGALATRATLGVVYSLATDPAGNLYIGHGAPTIFFTDGLFPPFPADQFGAPFVRKVAGATGVITTVAGTGVLGSSGDGGLGTNAQVNALHLSADAKGSVYVGQQFSVRVLSPFGPASITPVAGSTPQNAPPGSTFPSTLGVTVLDASGNPLSGVSVQYTVQAGTSGAAATLSSPALTDAQGTTSVAAMANGIAGQFSITAAAGIASTVFQLNNASGSGVALFLSASPAGAGAVVANPVSGNGNYPGGTRVCLSPLATPGYVFSGWSGATLDVGDCLTLNASASVGATFVPAPATTGLLFVPVAPCRIADTRLADGPFGGPAIVGGTSRDFVIPNSACNIPNTAAAYSVNLTVVPRGPLGYATIWRTGDLQPTVSTLNSIDGRVKANAAIVPAGTGGAVSILASNATNVVLDINGYFVDPATSPTALAFYPLPPCRVADTRLVNGSFGSPSLAGGVPRNLPIQSSACNVPASAQAYSLNFTAVPAEPLGYFTAWAAGQPVPTASTLNAITGTVTANAAIVPAGTNGNINLLASNNSDMVVDINGYFAPPGTGGLSLYNVAGCRILDTRNTAGAFSQELTVSVVGSACQIPNMAQAFVLNATVVPSTPLGYLSLWGDGSSLPTVSTLNSIDGTVISNMAIVPALGGLVDSFASNPTQLILDISSYFAP